MACGVLLLASAQLGAATITWADTGTDFATGANWVGGTAPANTANNSGDIASFGTVTSFQPNLAADRSVKGLEFTSTSVVTFSGGSGVTLTLGSSGLSNTSTSGLKTVSTNLLLNADQSFTNNGVLIIAGTVAAGGKVLTLGGAGIAGILSGNLSGTNAGGLTKTGSGSWLVSGANTYTGPTTVNGGTLQIGSSSSLANSAVTINATTAGTTTLLDLNGSNATITSLTFGGAGGTASANNLSTGAGTLTLGGNVTFTNTGNPFGSTFSGNLSLGGATRTFDIEDSSNAAADLTVSANISGAGAGLTKTGAGTLVLSGNNSYDGTTTVTAGTLIAGSNSAFGTGILALDGGTLAADAARTLGNAVTITANNSTIGGAADITFSNSVTLNANRTLIVSNTGTTSFSGTLAETGGARNFTKDGAGTLVLSGTNTYTGTTTVSAGVLNIRNNSALGGTGNGTSVTAGAALQLQGGITVSNEALTLNGTGVANDGALRNISGNNTWAGAVTLGSNATVHSDAGLLTISGNIGGNTRTLTVGGTGDTTLSGIIGTTSGGITKNDAGTLTLSGASANTYTGATLINDGTLNLNKTAGVNALGTGAGAVTIGNSSGAASSANLVLQASNQIANGTAITINSDGRLSLNNFSEAINTVAGSGLIDLGASGALTVGSGNGSSTFGGSVTGAGTLTKAGSGTLTLGSALNFAGEFALNAGTLALNGFNFTMGTLHITGNSSASLLNATNLIIDAGATLTINNWVDVVDYFYVTNNPGATALGQITFSGYAGPAKWQTYDQQVTPVPEPATYGAVLTGFATLLLAWRRRRSARA